MELELDGKGAVKASYTYGSKLIKSETAYYVFNGYLDVVQLTDLGGLVIRDYDYDPYGVQLSNGEGDTNPFRYKGEYHDAGTGLIYLRTRFYDPDLGRFISLDPARDGLNWYIYCGNNPINRADPSGTHWTDIVAMKLQEAEDAKAKATSTTKSNSSGNVAKNSFANAVVPLKDQGNVLLRMEGITVHTGSIAICTDGSNGTLVPDGDWQPGTAYEYRGNALDAYTVPYIVMPLGSTLARLGDAGLLINQDTGMMVVCIIGDKGPAWGEVSIKAIWDTGNPDHMTAKHASGLSSNYVIIIYPGVRYDWGQ